MDRYARRRAAAVDHPPIPRGMAMLQHEGRTYIIAPERAAFAQSELFGLPHAFSMGDLRAMVICQYWGDGECMNAWHIETAEQREAIIAKLQEMLAVLRRD